MYMVQYLNTGYIYITYEEQTSFMQNTQFNTSETTLALPKKNDSSAILRNELRIQR